MINGYLYNQLAKYPPLTRDEENALVVRMQSGDRGARDKLVLHNLRLAWKLAKRFRGRGLPMDDLLSEASIGLLRAAEKYSPDPGYRFTAYAGKWIFGVLCEAINTQVRMIRLPGAQARALALLRAQNPGTARELAFGTGLKEEMVREVLRWDQPVASLDKTNDEDENLYGCLSSPGPTPEDLAVRALTVEQMAKAMTKLTPGQRYVLENYYGLDGREPRNLPELGRECGVTKEAMGQRRIRALEALRHHLLGDAREVA